MAKSKTKNMGNHHSANTLAEHLTKMVEDEEFAQNRKQQREKIMEVFKEIDKNNNGTIERKEISTLFDVVMEGFQKAADKVIDDEAKLPQKSLNKEEVCELFKQVDENDDDKLDFNEFVQMVDRLCSYLIEGKNIQRLGKIAVSHKENK